MDTRISDLLYPAHRPGAVDVYYIGEPLNINLHPVEERRVRGRYNLAVFSSCAHDVCTENSFPCPVRVAKLTRVNSRLCSF